MEPLAMIAERLRRLMEDHPCTSVYLGAAFLMVLVLGVHPW
jgi:hypothetical protein